MNNSVTLIFKKAGLRTTVQDAGRAEYRHLGIPKGGVMDSTSAGIANELVENEPNTPVLEITFMGPEIVFEGDCQIAMTGADMQPEIDGVAAPMYETIDIKSGSVLFFQGLLSGCRTYLAVRGRWKVSSWLGSSAASCNIAALTPDSIVKRERRIKVYTQPNIAKKTWSPEVPKFPNQAEIRVLPGPEFASFSEETVHHFLNRMYHVSMYSNRMGYRIDNPIPDFKPGDEIISSGIIPGTIQITNSGQIVILMADAQTTGGYPRLANVITADLDKVAQLKPGDNVRFVFVHK